MIRKGTTLKWYIQCSLSNANIIAHIYIYILYYILPLPKVALFFFSGLLVIDSCSLYVLAECSHIPVASWYPGSEYPILIEGEPSHDPSNSGRTDCSKLSHPMVLAIYVYIYIMYIYIYYVYIYIMYIYIYYVYIYIYYVYIYILCIYIYIMYIYIMYIYIYTRSVEGPHSQSNVVATLHSIGKIFKGLREY